VLAIIGKAAYLHGGGNSLRKSSGNGRADTRWRIVDDDVNTSDDVDDSILSDICVDHDCINNDLGGDDNSNGVWVEMSWSVALRTDKIEKLFLS